MSQQKNTGNSTRRILIASLIGTTIEFFDFYIYALAAVLVFPKLFFPSADATASTLESLATFALAFFARPLGAALFGHFGDRKGRKATLVAALMTMGPSTVAIGLLPGYGSIGIAAPILLALFRFGQGLGLGGEWGGAVLLATENAPEGKKAWYGMFPQLGAPIGLLISTAIFLILTKTMTGQQFFNYGWRIPFIASAILVWVGLYAVRLKITDTPDFLKIVNNNERVKIPIADVFVKHTRRAGAWQSFASVAIFLLFYLMTVFVLKLGHQKPSLPAYLIIGGADDRYFVFWHWYPLVSQPCRPFWPQQNHSVGPQQEFLCLAWLFRPCLVQAAFFITTIFMVLGMFLIGLSYGPLGTALAEIFPASVRYTGASVAFTLAGILGASLTPSYRYRACHHLWASVCGVWYVSAMAAG